MPKGDERSHSSAVVRNADFVIGWFGKSYLMGIVVVDICGQFLHPVVLGNKLPFLPLMMISIYSGFGMMYSWIWQLKWIIGSI